MAALSAVRKGLITLTIPHLALRGIQTSAVVLVKPNKLHIRAGRFRPTKKRNLGLTYDESKPPHLVGVEKAWDSWNTSNLAGEARKSETLVEDTFIRNFMAGTWHGKLIGDVVIKRRHNMVVIVGFVRRWRNVQNIYFLQGYTEELLSCFLKCPVKLEIQTVRHEDDMIFKYV